MEQLILDLLDSPKAYTVKEIANELGIKNENDVRMVLTTLCDEFKVHQTKRINMYYLKIQFIKKDAFLLLKVDMVL
jgi:predicted ArsR family transcriptional regulator